MDDQAQQIIEQLRLEIALLKKRIDELEAENRQLREELAQATRSAAPFGRREESKIPKERQKRPGRKPGHLGSCRVVPKAVDQQIEVPLSRCPRCGDAVTHVQPLVQFIEEIPLPRPSVTRLVTYAGQCARCGEVRSTHPLQTSLAQGAAKVHLGPRALAVAASLNKQHGLTMRTTCRVLSDLTGLRLTPGGLAQAMCRVAGKVSGRYDQLRAEVRRSAAVFADETSWWVGRPGFWLWTFTTPTTTLYHVDEHRGSAVVRDMLGDRFAGMLVSDCLSSYDPVPYRKHKCIAHHLRAITQARNRTDTRDRHYLDQWKIFFVMVITIAKHRAKLGPDEFVRQRAHLEQWCDRLLAETRDQPGDKAIQKRLQKQRDHLLGCLYEPAAEPTNNRAERALRPAVIARKLSCGNKTDRGRTSWQVLASLAATCRQQTLAFIDDLAARMPLAAHTG
jgi:transposase